MIISAIIISKNAEHTIGKTLDSLADFDEVIVLDTGSTDQTLKIVRSFPNVKLYHSDFCGFGRSKNRAASLATNDWVLSIDADEVLSQELKDEIKNLQPIKGCVYTLKRCNFYGDRQIKHSGWGSESIVRIYHRNETSFIEKLVHEFILSEGLKIHTLTSKLNHYSYRSISDFTKKREFYSDLFSLEQKGKKKSSGLIAFVHAFYSFFSTYFFKKGFLDGYLGLLIAVSNAHVAFLKYIKLYEANLRLKDRGVSETDHSFVISSVSGQNSINKLKRQGKEFATREKSTIGIPSNQPLRYRLVQQLKN